MAVRRMLYRISRDRKFWIIALVLGYFYVSVSQLITMSNVSAQENQLRYENSHRRSGRKAEPSSGEVEKNYIHEYPDLSDKAQRVKKERDDSYGDVELLERNNEHDDDEDYYDNDDDDDDDKSGDDDEQKDVLDSNNDDDEEEEDDDDDDDDEESENEGEESDVDYNIKEVHDENKGDKNSKGYQNEIRNDIKIKELRNKDTEKGLNDENEENGNNPKAEENKGKEQKGNNEETIAGNLNKERPKEFQDKNDKKFNMEGEIKLNIKDVVNNIEKKEKEIFYNGYFKLNEFVDSTPVKKVILLTYQRAGSSFTGELLTAGGEAMYVFEPLYLWRKILGPGADRNLERKAALVLGDILDCRPEVI
ncbi:transcription initiation factor TFIID subunit 11-like [Palaemon carinicauda]|uniref:transcription initiation factor TFIID subunit 11-like n=1 Tax=Palaemon carinicauda TaxID=392227 RepID=UPI0035B61DE8